MTEVSKLGTVSKETKGAGRFVEESAGSPEKIFE